MQKVILAKNAGFCFGVKRAVDEALKTQKEFNKKIYTLGPLIHNGDVVSMLENNNIYSITLDEINNLLEGDIILIRSHGVSKKVMELLESKKLKVINATCPYVTNIQKKAEKYSNEGYEIVILGDKNHPEVVGINGWCNDSAIITPDGNFSNKLPNRVCVLSQTTERAENWQKTLSSLSLKTKEILAFNTICSATEVRQKSAFELSKEVDVMFVVGGKNSSNTTKLFKICKENCLNTFHIENLEDLKEIDKNLWKNKTIGITAGASTPQWIIDEIFQYLK